MNIYQKLAQVQEKLKAPKSQYNKHGNFYYRNCEDIQEGLKPLLKEVGATVIITDEIVTIGDRIYLKAKARFIDCETEASIENTSYAREPLEAKGMSPAQLTGSCSSYARKYALNGLLLIDDSKDSDTKEAHDQERAALIAEFKNEIARTHVRESYFLEMANVTSADGLTDDFLNKAIEGLKLKETWKKKDDATCTNL